MSDYDTYDAPESDGVKDVRGAAVVAGEAQYALLGRVNYAQPICWWLSIDYSYLYSYARRGFQAPHEQQKVLTSLRAPAAKFRGLLRSVIARDNHFLHLTQSQYAWSYLVDRKHTMPSMLSDYTPRLDDITALPTDTRRGISYNATKAEYVTSGLARHLPDVEFVPIIGMTQDEVYDTLRRTRLYLDLGAHPGKDRIPREAAIAGNIVVVGLRGAAAYSADVPIPFSHKLLMEGAYEAQAARRISGILSSAKTAFADQAEFRARILREKDVFDEEVRAFFIEGVRGFDAGHSSDLARSFTVEQAPEL
ncbi:hypothetical protein [Pseudarthrobacter defluvii]|uniref:hypothetical protein n=1 Tax=Pseudarthrobacter defluvii TaxID=410837 RepID=UPI0027D7D34E|nr:hypothetical protein [Pseudarthrobacter defluvii]